MNSSDSQHSSDDSGAGDDPHQSSAVPNSLQQLQGDYGSGLDDVVPRTPEKQFEEEDTGSRTALISTRLLSSPSACVFLHSVLFKIGKLMIRILILMVLIVILYSILPQPASAVSSARECLGRLSRNGHLMISIERLPTKKSRQLWRIFWTRPGQKYISSPMRIPLPDGD
jgi:hypothetical protein